tara:strand:- start:9215 stop:10189 length:975 start_codon:yes stop_codon:yes gene_type:complete
VNKKFINARNRVAQNVPPIWFMRQAGRYHSHYRKLKETYTFEELCKQPDLAGEVALGPIREFDYDVSILFSDILWPLEGLGLPLEFNPGPKFGHNLTIDNAEEHSNISDALSFLSFQREAVLTTRAMLPKDKSLIGFVGGPWTLMNYACGDTRATDQFKLDYMKTILIPLLVRNIRMQLDAGAEVVMIFDSGLQNMSAKFFNEKYSPLLMAMAMPQTAYYSKNLPRKCIGKVVEGDWGGIGVDSKIDISDAFKTFDKGFVQGNFDENKMLLSKHKFMYEIEKYCDDINKSDTTGWVCGLGHGIDKTTPEEHVHLFIETVRNRLS